jgi:lysophospholipase
VTFDWRGQGLSDRLTGDRHKGHVDGYQDYLGDLEEVIERLVRPGQVGRLALLAHSMGGHIALRHLCRRPAGFAAAVFSAPMWDLRMSPSLRLLARGGGRLARLFGIEQAYVPRNRYYYGDDRFEGNLRTSDRVRFARFQGHIDAEPGLALGNPTVGWLDATFDSIDALRREVCLGPPGMPILTLSAGADRIVDNAAHEAYAAALPDAEQAVFPDALHELLQERDDIFEPVLARTIAFLSRHTGPT